MSKTLPDLPPFRVPGSPNHINDHDLFDIWLAAVRDAFYPSPKYDFPAIPDPAVHGNPGHVEAHNRLRACAEYMKATDYASDSSFPPIPAEADEGEQGHVVAHNEFRDVFAYVAAHQPSRYNAATGGTVTTVENYNGTGQTWRVHTFTGNGTFTVTNADQPFRVLVVAGGGGGAGSVISTSYGGGGGAGGMIANDAATVPVGAHSVKVGAGGASTIENGRNGLDSTFAGFRAIGGGAGGRDTYKPGNGGSGGGYGSGGGSPGTGTPGQGHDGGRPHGGGAGNVGATYPNGASSTITGAAVTYATGGLGRQNPGANVPGAPNTGDGGCGASEADGRVGSAGGSGIVIVAYQIG